MNPIHSHQVLISQEQIQLRIEQLALEISKQYQGRPLTLLGIMTGSLFFLTDIMKQLSIPHQVGIIQASSYPKEATSPGELRINLDYLPELNGRDVLLIDDILDTGQTLENLKKEIATRFQIHAKTAVLLWKKSRTLTKISPDFLGFEIENKFVIGYGLDYAGDYRHLPDICVLNITTSL